jgi:hypothetical protein
MIAFAVRVPKPRICFRVEDKPGDLKKKQKSGNTDHLEGVRNEECSAEMDEAVAEWLEAHQGFERYLAATRNLYAVFARSWQGCNLAQAFSAFREALLRNSGYEDIEVTKD